MSTYQVTNRLSWEILGVYAGDTEQDAIRACYQDAGYQDADHAPGGECELIARKIAE